MDHYTPVSYSEGRGSLDRDTERFENFFLQDAEDDLDQSLINNFEDFFQQQDDSGEEQDDSGEEQDIIYHFENFFDQAGSESSDAESQIHESLSTVASSHYTEPAEQRLSQDPVDFPDIGAEWEPPSTLDAMDKASML
jgi:hypothetical protein